jgi:hypothetical protein
MTHYFYWLLLGVIIIIAIYEFFLTKIDSFYLFLAIGAFWGGMVGYQWFSYMGLIIGSIIGAWATVMCMILLPILVFGFWACNKECKKVGHKHGPPKRYDELRRLKN